MANQLVKQADGAKNKSTRARGFAAIIQIRCYNAKGKLVKWYLTLMKGKT